MLQFFEMLGNSLAIFLSKSPRDILDSFIDKKIDFSANFIYFLEKLLPQSFDNLKPTMLLAFIQRIYNTYQFASLCVRNDPGLFDSLPPSRPTRSVKM
ncbi:hypothetical protein N7533_011417 [Penicillium manginii]|jgi:hypothetical protein|uniref:uncharacterized protein n=1 Tax=Penicillium manginii TaxID=203109 RepID=UPI0025482CD8|nr:uncharacterized protein N7533_011417 [Penicillium manginii]KAJ5742008.1 hypothetical protein N7533_011417 [Penicillium manginii]